jgi:uncharacterized protein YbjT (DUF2867 family)
MTVLVVGANGQLGSLCCAELGSAGASVRGTVRATPRGASLARSGIELVEVDLASRTGFGEALGGVDSVVVTANTAAPRQGDDPDAVHRGLVALLEDADAAGVRRVVLVSVPESPLDDSSAIFRSKRELEAQVRAASFEHVIVRFPPFMECWLALVGSSLPLRGEPHATIGRPSPFLQKFRKVTGSLVEDRGLMLVPGSTTLRNAFISERDAARVCAVVLKRPDAAGRTFEIGGPEVLTWSQVAELYGEVLGRKIRCLSTPAPVYAAMTKLLKPVAAVPAATMALNQVIATTETTWPAGGGLLEPASMLTVSQFLHEKAGLPAQLPVVT